MNWQHVNILAATNYLRERIASGVPDARVREVYEGLLDVLDPSRIDVELTEEFQLEPEQSTSAIIIHHPEARYFSIE